MKTKVAVIGSGVSGMSTAIMLQIFGFDVSIYSKKLPESKHKDPKFGSLFPSASIIPHSVFHPQQDQIFQESNTLFSGLHYSSFPGLLVHDHFELYGYEAKTPDYAKQITGFNTLSDLDWTPKHPQIQIQSGYRFNCFFADWNIYFPSLIDRFKNSGGTIIEQNIDLNSPDKLSEDIIINCSGLGAHELKDESSDPLILMGHLVRILDTPPLSSSSGNPISYNFTPGLKHYSDSNQTPLDVYCYPRENDWILGGSRFTGTLDKDGNWISNDDLSTTFPAQIEKLNTEIIQHTFGINVNDLDKREYLYSYRYVRNKINGLRLENDQNTDQLMIHNYGHGGAGVTLSWGCAFRILNMIYKKINNATVSLPEVSEQLSAANIRS
ncbi:MAG: FAD-dependent oxidoreductase [Balneola sp.]